MPPEPRLALGARKPRRPHPAAPQSAGDQDRQPSVRPAKAPIAPDNLVMLCVRVTPVLRRRVKLAAAVSGRSIQAIATDALEQACSQCDM